MHTTVNFKRWIVKSTKTSRALVTWHNCYFTINIPSMDNDPVQLQVNSNFLLNIDEAKVKRYLQKCPGKFITLGQPFSGKINHADKQTEFFAKDQNGTVYLIKLDNELNPMPMKHYVVEPGISMNEVSAPPTNRL